MNTATQIFLANRTNKEKGEWAGFMCTSCSFDVKSNCESYVFKDGSELIIAYSDDGNLNPIDFITFNAVEYEEAIEHGQKCLSKIDGWDVETLSFNIESNNPDISIDDCYDIANCLLS